MTFVSLNFYIFLIFIIICYYIIPLRYRWYSLLAGSLGFYWYIVGKNIKAFSVLLGLALICWIYSVCIKALDKDKKVLMTFVTIAIVVFPLFVLKGYQLVDQVIKINNTLASKLIAPVGLSFYTLQLIAYCIDIYNDKIKPENNFLKLLLFASFFPQVIQGPIPRFSQLEKQLVEGHRFDEIKFVKGFMLILWAFFLKLCIADKAGIVVDTIFSKYHIYGGCYVLVGGILYSFQLYADFLSCTSFAQGISNLVGIDLIDNFNHPYFAKSIKDFWRRWHISLSSWLKDYIYIPLGGSRNGQLRKYVNVFIVFLISGLWHGDGVKFLFWGFLHAFYQVIGEILLPVRKIIDEKLGGKHSTNIGNFVNVLGTFFLVMLGWILFRADSLSSGLTMIRSIFTVQNIWILTDNYMFELGLGWKEFSVLIFCLIILFVISYLQETGVVVRDKILQYNIIVRWTIYVAAILFIMLFGTYGWGYDSQAFIYGGF